MVCMWSGMQWHVKDIPVDIVFSVSWEVIVNDQRHLLDVYPSGLHIEIQQRSG